MKKILIAALLMPFVLAGCAERSAQVYSPAYFLHSETISQGNINIKYPQITGLADEAKQTAINNLIKNDLWETEVQSTINAYKADNRNIANELALNLDYQVKLQTPQLLSILYTGTGSIAGGAFSNEVYAITIDLKEAKKLQLADFVTVDTNFANEVLQSSKIAGPGVDFGARSDVLTEIHNSNAQSIIEGFNNQEAYYTFDVAPDALEISIPISHAGGDYTLIEIPGQYAKNYTG